MSNMVLLRKLVDGLPGDTTVVVLPESWVGLPPGDPGFDHEQAVTFLKTLARSASVHVVGGALPMPGDGGRFHNRVHVVDPGGDLVGEYDKRILFGREQDTHVAGRNAGVFEIAGLRIGVLVCADMWRSELVGELAHTDAVFVCARTGVPSDAQVQYARTLWASLALTRAMEHGVPVAVSDWPNGRHAAKDIDVSVGSIHGAGTTFDRGMLYKHRRADPDNVPREPTATSPTSAAPALGAGVHYTCGAATICNPGHRPDVIRIQQVFERGQPGVLIETIDGAAIERYREHRRAMGLLAT
jgi:predicted amidohydrolase